MLCKADCSTEELASVPSRMASKILAHCTSLGLEVAHKAGLRADRVRIWEALTNQTRPTPTPLIGLMVMLMKLPNSFWDASAEALYGIPQERHE